MILQFHFRAKYMLGKTEDAEDKGPVEPFFLGHMVDTTVAPRRIYLDLGVKTWESSMCYMLQVSLVTGGLGGEGGEGGTPEPTESSGEALRVPLTGWPAPT